MNFLSLDLEMNQPSGTIIQVGAVVGNLQTGEVIERFCEFVHTDEIISDYIIQLTKVTQADVDSAESLPAVYQKLRDLHKRHQCFRNPLVWGGGDSHELLHQMKTRFADFVNKDSAGQAIGDWWCFGHRWLDVKTLCQLIRFAQGFKMQGGLAKTLTYFGMQFRGTKHNAQDDAENTFLLAALLHKHFALIPKK